MNTHKAEAKSRSKRRQKNRVNTRLGLTLFAALVISGTAIHFLHGYMVDRNASSLLDRAERLLTEAAQAKATAQTTPDGAKREKLLSENRTKRSDAVKYLQRYVQLNPDDHEAWVTLAVTSDEIITAPRQRLLVYERLAVALRKLEAANSEELKPTIYKLRRRFIKVAMGVGRAKQALEEIGKFPEEKQFQEDGDLLFQKGQCQSFLLNWKKAADSFELAITADPEKVESYRALMHLVLTRSMEIRYREYDPAGREDPTAQEVADSLADDMVKRGRPYYVALMNRANYRQIRSATTTDNEERKTSLEAAKKDIEMSVKEHASLIAAGVDSSTSGNAADGREIDPAAAAAADIGPLLMASTIFTTSARLAGEQGRGKDLEQDTKQAQGYARAALKQSPSDPRCFLALAEMTIFEQAVRRSEKSDHKIPIQYLRDGLVQAEKSGEIAKPVGHRLRWTLVNTLIDIGLWRENPESDNPSPEFLRLLDQMKRYNVTKERIEFLNARIVFQQGKWQEAIQRLETVHPKLIDDGNLSLRIDMLLGTCYSQLGDVDSQLRSYQRATQLAPTNTELRFRVTAALAQLGRVDEALEELRLTSFAIPRVAGTLAALYVEKMRKTPSHERRWDKVHASIEGLLKALEKMGRRPSADWTSVTISQARLYAFHAATLAIQNKNDPAQSIKNTAEAEKLLDKSESLLRAAIDDSKDNPQIQNWIELANLRFQRALLEKEENKAQTIRRQALAILDEAQQFCGDRVELRSTCAKSLALIEDFAAKQAGEKSPNQAARHKRRAETIQAIVALDDDAEKFTGKAERARLWQGISLALARMNESGKAQHFGERIIALEPYNIGVRLYLLELAIADMRNDRPASDSDEKFAQRSKNHLKKISRIVRGIREFEGPGGPSGNYAEGMRLLAEIMADRRLKGDTGLIFANPKLDQARELLLAAAKRRPSLIPIHRALGRVEGLVGNDQLAAEHYREAVAHGDLSSFTVNRLIPLLAKLNRGQDVIDLVEKIKDQDPEMLSEPQTVGGRPGIGALNTIALLKQGSFDKAIASIKDSIPNQNDYRYHLRVGQIELAKARQKKNVAQAKKIESHFREAVRLAPGKKETWLSLVAYLLEVSKREEAIQEIDKAKERLTGDFRHVVLATMLRNVGKLEEADAEYHLALKQHPDNVRVLVSAMTFYQKIGKADLAEEKLKAALARKPQDADLQSAAANFYAQSREKEKRNLSLKYLNKILNKAEELPSPLVKSARRRKAMIIAASGGYKNSEKARKILEFNLKDDLPDIVDLQAIVVILGKQSNPKARKEQIAYLKQIDDRQRLTPAGRLHLAKLYERTGQWHQARPLLLSLAASETNQAYYMAYFIRGLRRNKEFADAEIWLDQLKILMPQSFVAVLLEAEFLAAQNEGDRAFVLIKNYLDNDDVVTPEQTFQDLLSEGRLTEALKPLEDYVKTEKDEVVAQVLDKAKTLLKEEKTEEATALLKAILRRSALKKTLHAAKYKLAAASLSELKQYAGAEEIYRQYIAMRNEPRDVLGLIILIAKQSGRTDVALDLCDQLRGKVPPHLVASHYVSVLRLEDDPTPAQIKRVGDRIEAAVRENPDSNALITYLANFYDFQGRFSDTEALYFKIIEQNDRNVMVLNNLAWMLAVWKKDGKKALPMINRAIKMTGPLAEFLDTRGAVYLSLKKTKLAIADFQQAADDSSPRAPKLFHLAQAQSQARDYGRAKESLQTAIEEGLTEKMLHPLEKSEYKRLLKELKVGPKRSAP